MSLHGLPSKVNSSVRSQNVNKPTPRPRVRYRTGWTDAIPDELKARVQWVAWKYELDKSGRWTKVPYRARNTHRKASTTDPKTWGSYEQAVAAFELMRDESGADRVDGIGFVFSPDD